MNKVILSSRHYLNNANSKKLTHLKDFITEYRRVSKIYLDLLWDNGITLLTHSKDKTSYYKFDADVYLDCPKWVSTVDLRVDTWLTGRALKCCMNQVLGIIRGVVEKQRKRQFIANQKRSQHKKIPKRLRKAIRKNKPVKPDISNINPELNSICLDFKEVNNYFNGFIKLQSFDSRERGLSFKYPLKYSKHSNKLKSSGKLMTSFLLTEKYVDLRWEIEPKKNIGINTVGADQGKKTVLTLSDGQKTPDKDIHGHSLDSIIDKLARKKKGSKAFKKAQEHRKNFINWSINQLNLSDINKIKYEDVKYLRYKNNGGRKLSHWTYTLIKDKVEKRCKLEEVLLVYNDSTYMSQRCHQCGLVLKSNRKGKIYFCKNCGYEGDSDFNASCNHQQELAVLPRDLRKLKLNIKGFFWDSSGIYDLTWKALAVPSAKEVVLL